MFIYIYIATATVQLLQCVTKRTGLYAMRTQRVHHTAELLHGSRPNHSCIITLVKLTSQQATVLTDHLSSSVKLAEHSTVRLFLVVESCQQTLELRQELSITTTDIINTLAIM